MVGELVAEVAAELGLRRRCELCTFGAGLRAVS